MIFVASVSHAAANFSQYDDYGFPANYPAFLRGKPPEDKVYQKDVCRMLKRVNRIKTENGYFGHTVSPLQRNKQNAEPETSVKHLPWESRGKLE